MPMLSGGGAESRGVAPEPPRDDCGAAREAAVVSAGEAMQNAAATADTSWTAAQEVAEGDGPASKPTETKAAAPLPHDASAASRPAAAAAAGPATAPSAEGCATTGGDMSIPSGGGTDSAEVAPEAPEDDGGAARGDREAAAVSGGPVEADVVVAELSTLAKEVATSIAQDKIPKKIWNHPELVDALSSARKFVDGCWASTEPLCRGSLFVEEMKERLRDIRVLHSQALGHGRDVPTEAPTEVPTEVPAEVPAEVPTEVRVQTEVPTEAPTESEAPTEVPTEAEVPTPAPTELEAPTGVEP
ncbi:unnamed protein product [Amoebophrya sp. A25]|nr:unnamed protein product [Amoebophrya sp. A25]|eukprot:GSA25T00006653001.1